MGEWRADQSKKTRRYVWGETRGQYDDVWKDFAQRVKAYPELAAMKYEKIGKEIHLWRPIQESSGETYWTSCLRFVDDGWGYWTVFYRMDERRWRTTALKELPIGRAITSAAEFWQLRAQEESS
jgi:hypothetical protein